MTPRSWTALTTLLSLTLGMQATRAGEATTALVIKPGHEASIERLLAPQGFDTCQVGAHPLQRTGLGPGCEVHFHFGSGDGDAGSVVLALVPRGPIVGTAYKLTCGSAAATAPRDLARSFCERLEANGAREALAAACGLPTRDVWSTEQFIAVSLCALALLGALGALIWRSRRRSARAVRGLGALLQRGQERAARAGALLAATIGRAARHLLALGSQAIGVVRALAGILDRAARVDPGPLSVILLYLVALSTRLGLIILMPRHYLEYNDEIVAEILSPPTLNLGVLIWSHVGDLIGLGHELVWIRLPLIPLALLVTRSLVRIGRTLDAPWTGIAAALLIALLPSAAVMGAVQDHYYWELALSIWFVERLMTWWVARERCERGLILSAFAAMSVGNMAVLVVAPGLLVFLVVGASRGQRRQTLAWLLLLTLLMAPILSITVEQASAYLQMNVQGGVTDAQSVLIENTQRHTPFVLDRSALARLSLIALSLFDNIDARLLLGFGLLGLLAVRREPRGLALFSPIVTFYLAMTVMEVSFDNSAPLWPSLVLLPLMGLARLHPWTRGGPAQIGFACALILLTHATAAGALVDNAVLPHQNMTRIRGAIEAGGEGGVVMLGTQRLNGPYLHALCADAEDRSAYDACMDDRDDRFIHTLDDGLRFRDRHDTPALGAPFTMVLPEARVEGDPLLFEEVHRWRREMTTRCRRAFAGLIVQIYHCPAYEPGG
jgi:hypothetical protein